MTMRKAFGQTEFRKKKEMKKTIVPLLLAVFAATAQAQKMSVSEKTIDCGQVKFRNPVTVAFEITNKGNRPLVINKVLADCGCTMANYSKEPISKGTKAALTVTYDAKMMGHFHKQIAVYSNASDEPLMLTVRGVVVDTVRNINVSYQYKLGDLNADTDNIEFDDVNRGDKPYFIMNIQNTSSVVAQPQVMHLPNYLTAEVSPTKLKSGQEGQIIFTLNSRLLSDYGLTQTSVYLGFNLGDKVSRDKEITVSAVLLPDMSKLTDAERLNAPKMSLSSTDMVLLPAGRGGKMKGELLIENTGRSRLDVKDIEMYSSNMRLSLSKAKIAPGEKARLKVTADRDEVRNLKKEPRVLMITNDPEKPKVVIRIKTE